MKKKIFCALLLIVFLLNIFLFKQANAYSLTKERPVFLAWPLPSYIGVARISQFPNTPWTWNYLGLNSGMQCPPAFGYLEAWLPTWRDTSISWEQDAAQADPHQFQMIECYSTSGEAGTNGHEATDIKAPAGTPVFASADGKVAGWRLSDLNTFLVLKHCLGGSWDASNECKGGVKWYTTYMHMIVDTKFQQMDVDVPEHTQLGTIYNQGDNSHLHFEVGLDKRNYANYVNPWGRDEAPWIGCMWKDESICTQSNPGYEKYLFQTPTGRVFLKQDDVPVVEIHHIEHVTKIQLYGDRIAMLMNDGTLFVTDKRYKNIPANAHDFTFNWVKAASQVTEFQVTQNRLAILQANTILQVQEGKLSDSWGLTIQNVKSFSISDQRVGILTQTGELKIIEGDLKSEMLPIAGNVRAFQVIDSRLAVLDLAGNFLVQEGALTSEWKEMGKNIKAFQLSGTRVAIVNDKDELWVNDGNLRAEYLFQANNPQVFQLADDRMLLQVNGKWQVKSGSLFSTWQEVLNFPLENVILNGEIPVTIEE